MDEPLKRENHETVTNISLLLGVFMYTEHEGGRTYGRHHRLF